MAIAAHADVRGQAAAWLELVDRWRVVGYFIR
jgi:hypothetical protein